VHSTASILASNPRLKFEHDLRGWTAVTITPKCRNTTEYVAQVRHAIKNGEIVPRPRHRSEAAVLAILFPEIAEHFADLGVGW